MVDRPPRTPVARPWKVILGVLTVAAWAPILLAFAASGIAYSLGCRLNEADSHPCMLADYDVGNTLYSMFMMLWLAILVAADGGHGYRMARCLSTAVAMKSAGHSHVPAGNG